MILDGRRTVYTYENNRGPAMLFTGAKFGSLSQNEVEIRIANINKQTRDYLLTEGTPFNRVRNAGQRRNRIIVEAGRESYGYSVVFVGDITTVTMTTPPDIWVVIKALTTQYQKGDLVSRSLPSQSNLSVIAQQVATDLGLSLVFEAPDITVSNYTYTGSATKQVDVLDEIQGINAYVNDEQLVIKRENQPLVNQVKTLNIDTGMIGIPEFIDYGIRVKFLLDNKTDIGTRLDIESLIYPAANGSYSIYKLEFEIASRDLPFYYIAEGRRIVG